MARGQKLREALDKLFNEQYVSSLQAAFEIEIERDLANKARVVDSGLDGACSDVEAFDVEVPPDMYDRPKRVDEISPQLHPQLYISAEDVESLYKRVIGHTSRWRHAVLLKDDAVQALLTEAFKVNNSATAATERFLDSFDVFGSKWAFRRTPQADRPRCYVKRTAAEIAAFDRKVR